MVRDRARPQSRLLAFVQDGAAVTRAAVTAAVLAGLAGAVPPAGAADRPGDFDFYVLALSWSPSYCEVEGGRADRVQCAPGEDLGFIVHGLWAQREHGFP